MKTVTVQDVYQTIDAFAPFDTQEAFDHSGLQVGDLYAPVHRILVAVDMCESLIQEAQAKECDLIITHHPMLWAPLHTITEQDYVGRTMRHLIQRGMHYMACHTNVDKCVGGNSDTLIAMLDGTPTGSLPESEFALTFDVKPQKLSELLSLVRTRLADPYAYSVGADEVVTRCAVCSGAGAMDNVIDACIKNGIVYLTGEVKHHQLRYAADENGKLIVFGHFTSEQIFGTIIKGVLAPLGIPVLVSDQTNPANV